MEDGLRYLIPKARRPGTYKQTTSVRWTTILIPQVQIPALLAFTHIS
jgi:hypothetical protein